MPEESPASDDSLTCADVYRTIRVREGLSFDIALDAAAGDVFSRAFAQGQYPSDHLTDLMFQLVQRGDTVLDLGAHVGTFSLAAAALGCRVLAVEASPSNVALLEKSVSRNGFENMRVVPVAVADRAGVVQFIPDGPFGVVCTPSANRPSVSVRAVTVDQLLADIGWQQVDFIKMDVEGSEIAAVRGMARLLARPDAPPIIYESNGHTLGLFGQTINQLKRSLEQFGYRNYLVESGRLMPVRARDLQPLVVIDYLAAKRWPSRLTGWPIRGRLSRAELLERMVAACAHPHEHWRAHAAQQLQNAPGWLLAEPAVCSGLAALRNDTQAEVRAAAAWSINHKARSIAPFFRKVNHLRQGFERRLVRWLRRGA
jgi:FkbM family methyltransferase